MVPHPDFAVAVSQPLDVTTRVGVTGRVIALGWWVDPEASADATHQPTGTLYLVVDDSRERPMWIAQGDIVSTTLAASTG